jgi:microcystin-dependent protein
MPAHNHQMRVATQDNADVQQITNTASFAPATGGTPYQTTSNGQLNPQAITPTGGSQPHNNMQPYLTLFFNIALQGVFPPRG